MDVARPTGSDCVKDSRGVAVADFDGDGRLDVVINNNNETPTVYLNDLKRTGNAFELKLVGAVAGQGSGPRSTRDAIGASVIVKAGGKTMTRQVEAGSGYASESMRPLHFGIGAASSLESIEIRWPSGLVQRMEGGQVEGWVNKLMRVEEGGARAAELRPGGNPTPHVAQRAAL
jgi:hypothetical protein